jgi:hypothetical protein
MANFLKELFGNCPGCEQSFAKHHVTIVAEISHDGSEAQKKFLSAFDRHDLNEILFRFEHQTGGFLPLRLFAIRCLTEGVVLVVIAYVDVFEIRPEIFDYEFLDKKESESLLTSIKPEYWVPLHGPF